MEHIVKKFVHPIIVEPKKIVYLMEKVDGNVNASRDTKEFWGIVKVGERLIRAMPLTECNCINDIQYQLDINIADNQPVFLKRQCLQEPDRSW